MVDDCSGPATAQALGSIRGAKVLRTDRNRGFLHAVRHGVAAASGRDVVLLNNDTEVQPGWLEALLAAADSAGDVGAVGAKLLYPDGTLQEAGGVIWSDGSGLNVGRWCNAY